MASQNGRDIVNSLPMLLLSCREGHEKKVKKKSCRHRRLRDKVEIHDGPNHVIGR